MTRQPESLPPTAPLERSPPPRSRETGPDSRDLLPGMRLGERFEILARLGRGGAGWVYTARDQRHDRNVALKVLPSSGPASDRRQVLRELRVTRDLEHPNVVRALDLMDHDGRSVLVMELVDGEPLAKRLRRRGPLPVGEALATARGIAAGLEAAHARGIVHRDLKPGNVILDRDGRARIADFGLASLAGEGGGERQTPVGTPEYMAPEQVEGFRCDRRADVYAFGCVLYEMLTGDVPFRGHGPLDTALERLRRDPRDPCEVNATLPRWLGRLVLHCLARDPSQRIDSMRDVAEMLEAGESSEAERPTRRLDTMRAAIRRRRVLRIAGVAAVALVLIATGVVLRSMTPMSDASPPPLFADGVVRVAVGEADVAGDEPASRVLAAGVAEALRARLAALDDVVVLDAPDGAPLPATTEHACWLRALRLGDEMRIVATVVRHPGAERELTLEVDEPWEGSWERVDAIADALVVRYDAHLRGER